MRPPAPPRRPRRDPAPAPVARRRPARTHPARTQPAPTQPPAAAGPEPQAGAAGAEAPRAHGSTVAIATPAPAAVTNGFVERQAEREAAHRRLLLRRVLLTLLVVALAAGAGWAVLISPLLALERAEVSVTGTGTTVAVEDVMAVVEPQVGVPLARVDVAGVRDRLEDLTTVRTAQVARSWPHGLDVVVDAREPVAAAATPDGFALLGGDGVTVSTVPAAPEDLPLVTVPVGSPETAPTLQAVLTVLAGLEPAQLAEVATAGATAPHSITLVLADGAEVRWGSAEETELKAAVLTVLRGQPASVYDLTVPRSPTTVS